MHYDIEIYYQTGNSEGHHNETHLVDIPMATLEIAKENLKRIREHDKFFRNYPQKGLVCPDYCDSSGKIEFMVSDAKTHTVYPFWHGYFETLISARIVTEDSDMEYIP